MQRWVEREIERDQYQKENEALRTTLQARDKRLAEQQPIIEEYHLQERAKQLRERREAQAHTTKLALDKERDAAKDTLRVVVVHTPREPSVSCENVLRCFSRGRKSCASRTQFLGVNRNFLLDPLNQLKQGPVQLGIQISSCSLHFTN